MSGSKYNGRQICALEPKLEATQAQVIYPGLKQERERAVMACPKKVTNINLLAAVKSGYHTEPCKKQVDHVLTCNEITNTKKWPPSNVFFFFS